MEFIRLWRSFYSNKSRGLRKKAGTDDQVLVLIDSDISRKDFRKNWARLIQKIYNVDPLLCSKRSGSMRIISFIENEQVISKILKHLGLWEVKQRPPPRANAPPLNIHINYTARPGLRLVVNASQPTPRRVRQPPMYEYGLCIAV